MRDELELRLQPLVNVLYCRDEKWEEILIRRYRFVCAVDWKPSRVVLHEGVLLCVLRFCIRCVSVHVYPMHFLALLDSDRFRRFDHSYRTTSVPKTPKTSGVDQFRRKSGGERGAGRRRWRRRAGIRKRLFLHRRRSRRHKKKNSILEHKIFLFLK